MAAVVNLPDLKLGSTGPHINELQRLLNKVGLFDASMWGKIDVNLFGPVTFKAVQNFQAAVGIPQTGVVDSQTWTHLYVKAGEAKIVSDPTTVARLTGQSLAPVTTVGSTTATALGPTAAPATKPAGKFPFAIVGALAMGALAFYVYKKKAGGFALVEGYDDAGPTTGVDEDRPRKKRAPRLAGRTGRKKPVKYPQPENHPDEKILPGPRPGTAVRVRTVDNESEDPEADDFVDVAFDPGRAPAAIRLEADPLLWRSRQKYREDMRALAWRRARADRTNVHVVKRGTGVVLYRAEI